MNEKLTEWEKEYLEKHLPDKINSDFFSDNPSQAVEDIKWLLEIIKKLK